MYCVNCKTHNTGYVRKTPKFTEERLMLTVVTFKNMSLMKLIFLHRILKNIK